MEILKGNQDILSNKIKQTFNFVNLTYVKTDTNRLLLKSLQKDIVQVNSTVHHLSKELKALIYNRNLFIIMFQLRSHLATLCNGIHSLKVDILSFLNQISVIHSQKSTPTLLNSLDLTSLLIKLEAKLILHLRLALPAWDSKQIWYMHKFMKLQSFMMSDTLYVVLHTPLIDKSLHFYIFRIHNIPLVQLTLQKSFQYAIQEECLAIRLDGQYISFPLSMDIMACQVSNGQFCHINTPYIWQTLQSLAAMPFSFKIKIT